MILTYTGIPVHHLEIHLAVRIAEVQQPNIIGTTQQGEG